MMIPINGTILNSETWQALAQLSAAISAYAAGRATAAQQSAIEDLTARVRHPLKWALAHPLRATKRAITRL